MKIADLLESQKIKQRPGPKCWTGWHKAGTKLKGGVRVNNCVKNESVEGCVDANFTDNIITQVHETWSRKYKRSINCSHPRGFSQKAHCAARKKRQAGGKTRSKSVTEDSANIIVENMLHKLVNSGMTEVDALGWIDDRLMLNENLRKWFQQKWVRFGPDGKIRGACARGSNLEGKPKCLPQSKAHSLGKKGRATAARRKRREDSNPNRTGPARNVSTKETMTCPHCGGEMVEESQINEKTDACYYKVKSRYKVWPSAYASGALVQCRKRGAKNWGKSKAEESVAKNFADSKAKITLYTDPNYFGAEVDDEAGVGKPVVNLPLKDLVGFEPDVKMQDPKSAANMTKMVELIKGGKGHELPPILARRYKGGYQVLDGHHRFHAYQAAGAKTIPAKLIPDDEIQVIDNVDQTSPVTETLKKVKGRWALVSRKDPGKVLQYYHGSGHPSKEWVSKVERRVHSFSENFADSKAKITLYTDTNYYGAEVDNLDEGRAQEIVHTNPSVATLKSLARNNRYHSARFVIYNDGTVLAADSETYTHHSMAPAMGAWEVRGYVEYLGDNDYAYRSMELYSGLTKDHSIFRNWEKLGIENGNPDIVEENFADGRGPGRPGDSARHGIPSHATLAQLDDIGNGSGRAAQLARWQANMRRGRNKRK